MATKFNNNKFATLTAGSSTDGRWEDAKNNRYLIVSGKTDQNSRITIKYSSRYGEENTNIDFEEINNIEANKEFKIVSEIKGQFFKVDLMNTSSGDQTYLNVITRLIGGNQLVSDNYTDKILILNALISANSTFYSAVDDVSKFSKIKLYHEIANFPVLLQGVHSLNTEPRDGSYNIVHNYWINNENQTNKVIDIPVFMPYFSLRIHNPDEIENIQIPTIYTIYTSDDGNDKIKFNESYTSVNTIGTVTKSVISGKINESQHNLTDVKVTSDKALLVDLSKQTQTFDGISTIDHKLKYDLSFADAIANELVAINRYNTDIGYSFLNSSLEISTLQFSYGEMKISTKDNLKLTHGGSSSVIFSASLPENNINEIGYIESYIGLFDDEYGFGLTTYRENGNSDLSVFCVHDIAKRQISRLIINNGVINAPDNLTITLVLDDVNYGFGGTGFTDINHLADTLITYTEFEHNFRGQRYYNGTHVLIDFISKDANIYDGNYTFSVSGADVTGYFITLQEGNIVPKETINRSDFIDRMDGTFNPETNPSGILINKEDMNIYKITVTDMVVYFSVMDKNTGKFVIFYKKQYNTPIRNKKTSLPFTALYYSYSSEATEMALGGISFLEQAKTPLNIFKQSFVYEKSLSSGLLNIDAPVASIMNKLVFNNKPNVKNIKLLGISVATDGTKSVTFNLIKNAIYSISTDDLPEWTSVSDTSCALIVTSPTLISQGKKCFSFVCGKTSDKYIDLKDENFYLSPNETFCLTADTSADSEILATFYWLEE